MVMARVEHLCEREVVETDESDRRLAMCRVQRLRGADGHEVLTREDRGRWIRLGQQVPDGGTGRLHGLHVVLHELLVGREVAFS